MNDIEKSVDKAIERSDWRVEYMTLNAKIMEEREEAREEERIKNILTMISILKGFGIQDSKITEQISERFGITLDETYRYLDKYYEEEDKTNS